MRSSTATSAAVGGTPAGAPSTADDLRIAGLVALSMVDWPGNLVATVFLQGCPWDCGYCQNPALRDSAAPGTVTWADVRALLSRRRGLLDGVVFTGGEATRQAALLPAALEVREAGFKVGLHTAGAYPRRFAEVLPHLDWVGLDIKALPEDYGDVVGVASGGDRAWAALDLALAADVTLEVRLTLHPDSPQARSAVEVARRLRARGVEHLALQVARTEGTRAEFAAAAKGWDHSGFARQVAAMAAEMETMGFATLLVR